MRPVLRTTVLALAAAAAAVPGAAPATAARSAVPGAGPTAGQIRAAVARAERSRTLWATVNICDTRRYPHTLGVRGQMPALGFRSAESLEIQVNYYAAAKHRFEPVPHARMSIALGQAALALQQGGGTFAFAPHTGLLDATLTFTWKRGGRVLGQTSRRTTAGHHDADFGSPPRHSARQCRIR